MSKRKDCFGSETYVCMTRACPYVSECVKVVWEKKLRRILARSPASVGPRDASSLKTAGGVRLRSREFTPGGSGDASA
jgi:hypothetical protein